MPRSPQPPVDEARASLGLPELEQAIHSVDARALLVPPRILRRVIKRHSEIAGFGLRVPHRKTYIISRTDLLAIVEPAELDQVGQVVLSDTVILLARPAPQTIATQTADALRVKFWRLLFHVRVHLALEQSVADERFSKEIAQRRIAELGEAEFAEIRAVLRQEDFLLPPQSDWSIYAEFVALYLELTYFARHLLPTYFPELRDLGRVDDIVGQDLDAPALLAAARLPGAPDLSPRRGAGRSRRCPCPSGRNWAIGRSDWARPAGCGKRPNGWRRPATWSARQFCALGPLSKGSKDKAPRPARAAAAELARLVRRLDAVCGLSPDEIEQWSRALVPLLDNAARGVWPPEARLLYDLQKVCLDHERGVYALNFWQWAYSLAQKPLKRELPAERDVLVVKHLAEASARLASTRISLRHRRRLELLLQTAEQHVRSQLRSRFRTQIDAVLDRVELVPHNLPERVARQKLVDELVDRIVNRGFLAMGDLRDALSRNNLKLPDVDTVGFDEWLSGDQLLQVDRLLAEELDGVYRSGELYMRLPQRLSSLAFGTPLGRFFTRYVAIPFGGAYLALEGIYHLVMLLLKIFGLAPTESHAAAQAEGTSAAWWLTVLGLGIFLEAVLHHAGFRKICLEACWAFGRLSRWLLVDWLREVLRLPWVRAILASPYFRLAQRYIIKPGFISLLLGALVSVVAGRIMAPASATILFICVTVLVNSRLGRDVDELVTDLVVQAWYHIRIHVVSALFRFIVELFHRLLETIERLLYTVDEWLRFKAGERKTTTVFKVIVTPVWRVLNYVIRFFVNLLIEPQINPIKHFPVVTVSHKFILPFLPLLIRILEGPLGPVWAKTIATPTIFLVPGVFGFLAWELKENWRLYAANRPRDLKPLVVGHHGETIIEFLHPGFRSGTLPKLYARLRKAQRRSIRTGNLRAIARKEKLLAEAEEHLRRFVQRDLLMLLVASRGWHTTPVICGEILLGTNRILIELYAAEMRGPSLWIALEDQAGWLVASIDRPGWIDKLSAAQRGTLANALAGFYKMAGVDLVREQLDAHLAPENESYRVQVNGLVVRGNNPGDREVLYPLSDWPQAQGADRPWPQESRYPSRQELIFSARPIAWQGWVQAWQRDQAIGTETPPLLADAHLLPGAE